MSEWTQVFVLGEILDKFSVPFIQDCDVITRRTAILIVIPFPRNRLGLLSKTDPCSIHHGQVTSHVID
jgi:hypothetical protein